jgi:hypothetical protein
VKTSVRSAASGPPCAQASWSRRRASETLAALVWRRWPDESAALPDLVLGEDDDFTALEPNTGRYWPGAATLNLPYGLTAAGGWLIAADTANSRLLAWRNAALAMGAGAKGLAGQAEWSAWGDNHWQPAVRDSLRGRGPRRHAGRRRHRQQPCRAVAARRLSNRTVAFAPRPELTYNQEVA